MNEKLVQTGLDLMPKEFTASEARKNVIDPQEWYAGNYEYIFEAIETASRVKDTGINFYHDDLNKHYSIREYVINRLTVLGYKSYWAVPSGPDDTNHLFIKWD
jgi:hypothetical protein